MIENITDTNVMVQVARVTHASDYSKHGKMIKNLTDTTVIVEVAWVTHANIYSKHAIHD